MARFRCCGNYTVEGHTRSCPLKPPPTEPTYEPEPTPEEKEEGCQFDIVHLEHIGECKGTCDDGGEVTQLADESGDTLVIVLIENDGSEESERRIEELEKQGLRRLTEDDLRQIIDAHDRGDLEVEVQTMTLDQIEEQVRERDRYLTIKEAASALGFSEGWTRTLCRRDMFEGAIKLRRRWAIPQKAIYM